MKATRFSCCVSVSDTDSINELSVRRDLNNILWDRYRNHRFELWTHEQAVRLAARDCGRSEAYAKNVIERRDVVHLR